MLLLRALAKDSSRAVFVVTHDPRILPFADRILRIEDGRIVGERRSDIRAESQRALKHAR